MLTLLHLDDTLVAIDKPPGLLVHPTSLDAHATSNALALLTSQLDMPLWPVHRLDKATSGVLLFARDIDTARALGAAFEAGIVTKRYLALVRGWPPDAGEIDYALARDPELPSAGQVRVPAVTRFRVLARHEWPIPDGRHASSRCAVVEVSPLTGRRHQIRRHFKHLAHPVIGDSTHGKGPLNRALGAWLGVQRLWLHAYAVVVPGLAGDGPRRIDARPGPEWQALLRSAEPALSRS